MGSHFGKCPCGKELTEEDKSRHVSQRLRGEKIYCHSCLSSDPTLLEHLQCDPETDAHMAQKRFDLTSDLISRKKAVEEKETQQERSRRGTEKSQRRAERKREKRGLILYDDNDVGRDLLIRIFNCKPLRDAIEEALVFRHRIVKVFGPVDEHGSVRVNGDIWKYFPHLKEKPSEVIYEPVVFLYLSRVLSKNEMRAIYGENSLNKNGDMRVR